MHPQQGQKRLLEEMRKIWDIFTKRTNNHQQWIRWNLTSKKKNEQSESRESDVSSSGTNLPSDVLTGTARAVKREFISSNNVLKNRTTSQLEDATASLGEKGHDVKGASARKSASSRKGASVRKSTRKSASARKNTSGRNSVGATKDESTGRERKKNTVKIPPRLDFEIRKEFFENPQKRGHTFNVRAFTDPQIGKVAVKWIGSHHACRCSRHFMNIRNSCDVTKKVLSAYESAVDTNGWEIRVVVPRILDGSRFAIAVEPYFEKVRQFNSNTFTETGAARTYAQLVIGLSHFSYFHSGGRYVFGNLQGGVDEISKTVSLFPPVLVSETAGKNGCLDLGGVSTFLSHHKCNWACKQFSEDELSIANQGPPRSACRNAADGE